MFPIADGRGRVIAFGGARAAADAKPKYINTGETALFSKGAQLYNFATARAAALKAGTIIVAEGYMDVIALVRAGFAHAVAPLGTALTEDQLQLLWRTAPEPILAFDGDEAGLKAAHRAAHLALPHLKPGHSLRFAFLPPGEDPDSLIAKSGPAAMGTLLDAGHAAVGNAVAGRDRRQGFLHARAPRRAGAGACGNRRRDRRRQDRRLLPPRFRPEGVRRFQAAGARPGRGQAPQGRGRPFRAPAAKGPPRPQPGTAEAVSPAVKASSLAGPG